MKGFNITLFQSLIEINSASDDHLWWWWDDRKFGIIRWSMTVQWWTSINFSCLSERLPRARDNSRDLILILIGKKFSIELDWTCQLQSQPALQLPVLSQIWIIWLNSRHAHGISNFNYRSLRWLLQSTDMTNGRIFGKLDSILHFEIKI